MPADRYPVTPDGRYFIVRGRLWRSTNPTLAPAIKEGLVSDLMEARRDVHAALQSSDGPAERKARKAVERAKRLLGERGPVWWEDGAPDYNRRLVKNSPYAEWFMALD